MLVQHDKQATTSGGARSNVDVRPSVPDILIHLHIPKTGGTSLNSMVQHAFAGAEISDTMAIGSERYNCLGLAPYELCRERFASYAGDDLRRIRYVTGHLPMGLHRAFDRTAKYFTVIRHPVDRVISDFFFRIQDNEPFMKDGKLLPFEEYVESRYDVYLRDYQVRVISGSPEFEAPRPPLGMQISGPAVEHRHLEQAKRNIEQHFLAAAPLEKITELALLIRRVYGWPMRRLLTEYKARTRKRPRTDGVSPGLLRIIEDCNAHDLELYEWVAKRFAAQSALFEPGLSRDEYVFSTVSQVLNGVGKLLPWTARKRLAKLLFYA